MTSEGFAAAWPTREGLFPDGIDRVGLELVNTKLVGPDGVQIQISQRAG